MICIQVSPCWRTSPWMMTTSGNATRTSRRRRVNGSVLFLLQLLQLTSFIDYWDQLFIIVWFQPKTCGIAHRVDRLSFFFKFSHKIFLLFALSTMSKTFCLLALHFLGNFYSTFWCKMNQSKNHSINQTRITRPDLRMRRMKPWRDSARLFPRWKQPRERMRRRLLVSFFTEEIISSSCHSRERLSSECLVYFSRLSLFSEKCVLRLIVIVAKVRDAILMKKFCKTGFMRQNQAESSDFLNAFFFLPSQHANHILILDGLRHV